MRWSLLYMLIVLKLLNLYRKLSPMYVTESGDCPHTHLVNNLFCVLSTLCSDFVPWIRPLLPDAY